MQNMKYEATNLEAFDCTNEIEDYSCNLCSFNTKFLASLNEHIKDDCQHEAPDEMVYKCLKCNFLTNSKYMMLRHSFFSKCATTDDERKKMFVQWAPSRNCSFKTKLDQISSLQVLMASRVHSLLCKHCSAVTEKENLKNHVKYIHPEDIDWFKSELCSSRSKRRNESKQHKKNVPIKRKIIKWHECDYCTYRSKYKYYLKSHVIYRHTKPEDIRWFECDHCPLKCKLQSEMKSHMKYVHAKPEDIKWFQCDVCTHKFKKNCALKQHKINVHTKNKQFQWFHCAHCWYKTKYKGNLKQHVISLHTEPENIKWFKCEHCSSNFKHKRILQYHLKTYHPPNWRTRT